MTTSHDEASSPTPRMEPQSPGAAPRPRRWLKDATAAPAGDLPPPPSAPPAPRATLPPPPVSAAPSRRWFKSASPPWVAAGVFALMAVAGAFLFSLAPSDGPGASDAPNTVDEGGVPTPSPSLPKPSPTLPPLPTTSPAPTPTASNGLSLPSLPLP